MKPRIFFFQGLNFFGGTSNGHEFVTETITRYKFKIKRTFVNWRQMITIETSTQLTCTTKRQNNRHRSTTKAESFELWKFWLGLKALQEIQSPRGTKQKIPSPSSETHEDVFNPLNTMCVRETKEILLVTIPTTCLLLPMQEARITVYMREPLPTKVEISWVFLEKKMS